MNLSYLRDRIRKIVAELEEVGEINVKNSIKYDGVFIPIAFFRNHNYKKTLEKLLEEEELKRMVSKTMTIGSFNKLTKNYILNKDVASLVKGIKEFEEYASRKNNYNIYVPIKGVEMYKDNVSLSKKVDVIKIDEQSIADYQPQLKYDNEISQLYPTALRIKITSADFQRAMEHAIDIGKLVVNYLRLVDYRGWDENGLTVRLPGYGFIKEELRVFGVDDSWDGIHSWRNRKKDKDILEVDHSFIEDIENLGKEAFGNLIDKHLSFESSDLDKSILRSITWYGEAKVEVDEGARFIKLMLAIESLFNTNNSDPITATLRDRLAFVLGGSIEERLNIANQFTNLYKLRSKIVHHGNSNVGYEELLTLQDFAANAIVEFLSSEKLLTLKNKKEMQDFFERKKFSN